MTKLGKILVLGLVVVIILALAGVGFYHWRRDGLLAYAPEGTDLYAHFELTSAVRERIATDDMLSSFACAGSACLRDFAPIASEISFVMIDREEDPLPFFILRADPEEMIRLSREHDFHYESLEQGIYAAVPPASDIGSLDFASQSFAQAHSLELDAWYDKSAMRAYVSKDFLNGRLLPQADFASPLVQALFFANQDLVAKADAMGRFRVAGWQAGSERAADLWQLSVPQDFELAWRSSNGLSRLEPWLSHGYAGWMEPYLRKAGITPEHVGQILNGQAEVLLKQGEKGEWHYVAAFQPSEDISPILDKMEQAVSLYAAERLPKEKATVLADGSLMTEFVADAESFIFSDMQHPVFDNPWRRLNIEDISLDFLYIYEDGTLYLSDSPEKMIRALKTQGHGLFDNESLKECRMTQKESFSVVISTEHTGYPAIIWGKPGLSGWKGCSLLTNE